MLVVYFLIWLLKYSVICLELKVIFLKIKLVKNVINNYEISLKILLFCLG